MLERNTQRYERKNIRIGADIPRDLRDNLHKTIPPGLLSKIIRTLLESFLSLQEKEGARIVLISLMSDNIELILKKKNLKEEDLREENEDENRGIQDSP